LTLGLADDTQDRQFALAMLDSLEINAQLGDFVKVTSNFKAKKSADGTYFLYFQTQHHVQRIYKSDCRGNASTDLKTCIEGGERRKWNVQGCRK
jgi:hypothetical protein